MHKNSKHLIEGHLAYVSKMRNFSGNNYVKFLVRCVLSGTKYRVHDYWFSANEAVREALKVININDPVNVVFEIATEQKDYKGEVNYKTKLQASSIHKMDGGVAQEWYWYVQDYTESREAQQLKKMHPRIPFIIGVMDEEHNYNSDRKIEDIVTRQRPRKEKTKEKTKEKVIEPNNDLPF